MAGRCREKLLEVCCHRIEHRRGNRIRAVFAKRKYCRIGYLLPAESVPTLVCVVGVVEELETAGVVGVDGDREAAKSPR